MTCEMKIFFYIISTYSISDLNMDSKHDSLQVMKFV